MKIFDLHCDTVGECCKNNLPLLNSRLHFSLEKAKMYEEYVQVFAVWIPDELRGDDAVSYFNGVADYFYKETEINKDIVSLYDENTATPVKAILSVEGASACGGTIDGLLNLHKKGVKIITLTWNGKNEIASGAFSEGGFTDFGKEFVKTAEDLGIVLDVSHLNRRSFFEFLNIAEKPFIASHSNADTVNNKYALKRNLTDEQIRAVKSANGIIGLNYCRDFIENEGVSGIEALAQQIRHFVSLGCEDVIALGSDFDGCEIHPELSGAEKLANVYDALLNDGFERNLINKIFYENAHRFFSKRAD